MREKDKIAVLRSSLSDMKRVIVAFSGGVDSSLLLHIAADELAGNVIAATAVSPIHGQEEIQEAKTLAARMAVRHILIETDEMEDPDFVRNPENRCYFCKYRIFSRILALAKDLGITHVLDGSNRDDLLQIRPGMKALRELGIKSPLADAGLTKQEIRRISRRLGLAVWNKPALACLASRIPFGTPVTAEALKRIHSAEKVLLDLGFGQIRVRDHHPIARIEIQPGKFNSLMLKSRRELIVTGLKNLGYKYITLDLEGYRTGSLHGIEESGS